MAGRSASLTEAVAAFQNVYMPGRNLAVSTREEYTQDIADLIKFLEGVDVRQVDQIGLRHLQAYLAELDRRGYAALTRRRRVSAIKTFFDCLVHHKLVGYNIAEELIPPERSYPLPRVLTETEYRRLRQVVANNPRDAAIIEVLLQTGITLSELIKLTIHDVEVPQRISSNPQDAGTLRVKGKGHHNRAITLNWKVCQILKTYLEKRPEGQSSVLFLTKHGRPFKAVSIQYLVDKYLQAANIEGASVRTLRHTMATHMIRKGASLRSVQRMLGHASVKTTAIYQDLARKILDEEIQRYAL